jgi:predicted neutral ceramidase superfamily lipid hydrolase
LFYEKRVRSFAGLKREARRLDSDAGIRVVGSYLKHLCFAFVTRSVGRYTVMVYERRGRKAPAVGKRILSREFESPEELEEFFRRITKKGVDAYVY